MAKAVRPLSSFLLRVEIEFSDSNRIPRCLKGVGGVSAFLRFPLRQTQSLI